MRRRSAFGLLSCLLLAVPGRTNAQEQRRLRRVGWLVAGELPSLQRALSERAEPFRKRGWVIGRNMEYEVRTAADGTLFERYASELVALNVDVLVTFGRPATQAAVRATSAVPIAFSYGGDPVRDGFVVSLAKPGRNLTGLITLGGEVDAKRLWLLRELLPAVRKVAVLVGHADESSRRADRLAIERIYTSLGFQPLFFNPQTAADFAAAIGQAARAGAEAAVVYGIYFPNGPDIAALAIHNRLPLIGADPELVESGILASVASDLAEEFEILALFVDRILHGTKPSDLPVQQPSRFEICINRRTAAALGVPIPRSVEVSATRMFG